MSLANDVINRPVAGVRPVACRCPLRTQRLALLALLVMGDAAALVAAFGLAFWVRFDLRLTVAPEVVASTNLYAALTSALALLWLLVFAAFELYTLHPRPTGPVETTRVFRACTMAALLVIVATFLLPTFVVSRMWLISAWGFSFVLVAADRFVLRRVTRAARRRGYLLSPSVIVGTNEEAASLADFLRDWQASGVRTLGFASAGGRDVASTPVLPVLGTITDIRRIVEERGVEEVIVAITGVDRDRLLQLYADVDALPVRLRLSSGLYEMLTTRVSVQTLNTVPLMSLQKTRLTRQQAAAKALLDASLVIPGLVLISPLMALIALAITLDSKGPIIYRRRVLGANGRQFDAFKFRTMCVNGDDVLARTAGALQELAANHKLKDDPRVTRVGRWLRKSSLDELPQLFNVLSGQMALVGPRMITAEELEKYGRRRVSLLAVKPGITGLWQVSGRSDVSYDERVRMDMYYVRHYSIWLDLQILFVQTPPAVLRSRGAY